MKDSRSIEDLHPLMRARVEEWLTDCKTLGLEILITCTFRSLATQAILYTYGRTVPNPNSKPTPKYPLGKVATNAQPGESPHNFGLAIDFVIMNNGKADWTGTSPNWNKAIELAQGRGMKSLRPMESAHLQLTNWKEYAT
jgi:peptidoglycan L-alanyl-D-glutamate endopeptidase CwlK